MIIVKKRQHVMSRFVHRRVWIFSHRYRVGEKYTRIRVGELAEFECPVTL